MPAGHRRLDTCTSPEGAHRPRRGPAHLRRARQGRHRQHRPHARASRTFTVDSGAPDTSITVGPPAGGTITTASTSFSFTSPELGATFECKLDARAWGACPSPKDYTGLGDGSHTFSVRAKDAAGNTDATPASRTFTVDATPPETTITAGGQRHHQPGRRRLVRLHRRDRRLVRVPLDSGGWETCTSPKDYFGPLPGRAHVRGAGQGRRGQRGRDAGHAHVHGGHRRAGHDDHGRAPRDHGHAPPLRSPAPARAADRSTASSTTAPGRRAAPQGLLRTCPRASHTFSVRAKDALGNTDQPPHSRTLTVDTVGPTPRIDVGPGAGRARTAASPASPSPASWARRSSAAWTRGTYAGVHVTAGAGRPGRRPAHLPRAREGRRGQHRRLPRDAHVHAWTDAAPTATITSGPSAVPPRHHGHLRLHR